MFTINKIYSGLILWSFEMPNAPYYYRYEQLAMKKLVLLILFLSYNYFTDAQEMLNKDLRWYISENLGQARAPIYRTIVYRVKGDTIINNLKYSTYEYTADTSNNEWFDAGVYMRYEDKKYYRWVLNRDVLFVNNRWKVDDKADILGPYCEGKVRSRRELKLAGLTNTYITTTANTSPTYVVEIGLFEDLFNHSDLCVNDGSHDRLDCVYKGDSLVYIATDNPNFECYKPELTNISNAQKSTLSVEPNICLLGESIRVKSYNVFESITVFDLNGRVIEFRRNLDAKVIELQTIQQGMHIIRIADKEGKIELRRVLVQ